ncbi:hypothetical protein [Leifsonia poae]|uniref:hypothetical protein n=1 Tax=Leifsonia poae TaxID=110933 RepID=UPI003D66A6A8
MTGEVGAGLPVHGIRGREFAEVALVVGDAPPLVGTGDRNDVHAEAAVLELRVGRGVERVILRGIGSLVGH